MELVSSEVDAKGHINEHFVIDTSEVAQIKSQLIPNAELASRVSLGLVMRLLRQSDSSSLPRNVVNQIQWLDSGQETTMKKAEQFKGDILRRLWHQHYWSAESLQFNMFNENGLLGESSDKKFMRLYHLLQKGELPGGLASLPWHLTVGALKSRSKSQSMTGEWIIFAKHKGKNYYLDIAGHNEGGDQSKLLQKLKDSSQVEYPFLWSETLQ